MIPTPQEVRSKPVSCSLTCSTRIIKMNIGYQNNIKFFYERKILNVTSYITGNGAIKLNLSASFVTIFSSFVWIKLLDVAILG